MRILDLVALAGLTAVPSSADDPLPPHRPEKSK
jgi:hypothetical protein